MIVTTNPNNHCALRSSRRCAFTLLEMLCVITLLGIIGLTLTVLLLQTLEIERLQARGFNKILESNALADQFRADVAGAEKAPPEWDEYEADEETLILAMKDGSHVVYRWRDARLKRLAFVKDEITERRLGMDGANIGVEFVHADRQRGMLRLRLHTIEREEVVPGQSWEIAAALGGDWR